MLPLRIFTAVHCNVTLLFLCFHSGVSRTPASLSWASVSSFLVDHIPFLACLLVSDYFALCIPKLLLFTYLSCSVFASQTTLVFFEGRGGPFSAFQTEHGASCPTHSKLRKGLQMTAPSCRRRFCSALLLLMALFYPH